MIGIASVLLHLCRYLRDPFDRLHAIYSVAFNGWGLSLERIAYPSKYHGQVAGDRERLRFPSCLRVILPAVFLMITACDIWRPPPSTPEQFESGLVVMYPGAANVYTEMAAWHDGLREYGVQHAIEVMPWGQPWDALTNLESLDRNRGWSEREAKRIAAYTDEHPDRPVTLIGYSSGAMIAIMVVESLPEQKHVDRVILMSATVSRDYDLTAMLENTRLSVIHYYSPADIFSEFVSLNLGATDRVFDLPGATVGFTIESDKLIQIPWSPEMRQYGNQGGHFDILFRTPFIRDFVGPWVAVETSVE